MDVLAFAACSMRLCNSSLSMRIQRMKSVAHLLKSFFGSFINDYLKPPPPVEFFTSDSSTEMRAIAVWSAASKFTICCDRSAMEAISDDGDGEQTGNNQTGR